MEVGCHYYCKGDLKEEGSNWQTTGTDMWSKGLITIRMRQGGKKCQFCKGDVAQEHEMEPTRESCKHTHFQALFVKNWQSESEYLYHIQERGDQVYKERNYREWFSNCYKHLLTLKLFAYYNVPQCHYRNRCIRNQDRLLRRRNNILVQLYQR